MPLKSNSYADVVAHLAALDLARGDDVLVQSRLTSFGTIDGGVESVYRALRDVVGPEGTIVVPTYRLRAPATEVYDRATSPGLEVGVLSEYVRTLPGSVRSDCAMHSHAANGPKSCLLESVTGDVSIGPGSDFDVLERAGFHILMLGCDFRIATFVVHAQAMHGQIPYRTWLNLPRPRTGRPNDVCRYYGRTTRMKEDLPKVGDYMAVHGMLKKADCAYGHSFFMTMSDVQRATMELLARDAEFLIRPRNG